MCIGHLHICKSAHHLNSSAITLISAGLSTQPRISLADTKQLVLFLMVPLAFRFVRGNRGWTLVPVIFSAGAVSAAYGILQYSILHYDISHRARGTLGHYMTYSGLVMLVLGAALRGLVLRPVQGVVRVLEAMAAGDTSRRLQVRSADEIGRLSAAVNQTVDAMQRVLDGVRQKAQTLTASVEDLGRIIFRGIDEFAIPRRVRIHLAIFVQRVVRGFAQSQLSIRDYKVEERFRCLWSMFGGARSTIAKFSALAAEWWNPNGPFGALHRMNPVRLQYIRELAIEHFGTAPRKPLEGVRALGLAARFVTGYLYDPALDGADANPAYPHAWIEVYLPGAGWVEFDPTNGIIGTERLIRVAVGRDPDQVMPIKGSFTGAADVVVTGTVDVKVRMVGKAQPAAVQSAPPAASTAA